MIRAWNDEVGADGDATMHRHTNRHGTTHIDVFPNGIEMNLMNLVRN